MIDFVETMDQSEDIEKGLTEGTMLDHFGEIDEVVDLISDIPNIVKTQTSKEMADEKLTEIIDKYLEQPHLIDPHLDNILQLLLKFIQDKTTPNDQLHCAFKYLYLVTKVRGPKVMVKKFPHEVADLEPIMEILSKQSLTEQETWETRYMLILWLSMICLIPFDMVRFDAHGDNSRIKKEPMIARILNIGKLYLVTSSDNCQEAAAILLSKFITRPDVLKTRLAPFIDWCLKNISDSNTDTMTGITVIKGCLSTMALIFKHGKRADLLQFCSPVLEFVQTSNVLDVKNLVLRKLVVKLTQRIGMTLLKPRLAAWRYQRGNRSLDFALKQSNMAQSLEPASQSVEEDNEGYDIPEEVENVLEIVLNCLKDKDTVVRWSSAKGVGRITGRLPKELADEVVQSVLENFSIMESDSAWHGGCLALAELGRRGLLLPERLKDVVPILLRALTYDERRGACSVGAHVRDAACYLAWSFARAYKPETLSGHVNDIAQTLLITTVFDREVNCRRAASAAFQENVGRQGHFPHGIDILTMADYFAVSNRTNTYLNISPSIGKYKEYTKALIEHLVQIKRDHWDSNIRWLAAQSMHKLTKLKPDFVSSVVLDALVPLCTGIDLVTRHGSILIVAEVVHSLHEVERDENRPGLISRNPSLKLIFRIVKTLMDAKLFRGFGGELMRVAACHLIARLSQCTEIFTVPKINNDTWLELIHDTLSNLHNFTNAEEICTTAVSALSSINKVTLLSDVYVSVASERGDSINEAVELYLTYLSSAVESQRCGYCHAIASLPKPVLQGCFMKVCHALFRAASITDKAENYFAESRRDAIYALSRVCKTVGVTGSGDMSFGICHDNVDLIYNAFFSALNDYTRSKQGDVGSLVRSSAIKGLQLVTEMIAAEDAQLLSSDIVRQMMCGILQQACEKIHKVRDLAAAVMVSLLHNSEIPHIPCKHALLHLFPSNNKTFPMVHLFDRLSKLLDEQVYAYNLLLGFIVSVGDLTQSLAEASGDALFSYMESIANNREKLDQFCFNFISVFRKYVKNDRVSVPLLKTLQQLLVKDSFCLLFETGDDDAEAIEFQDSLLSLVKEEITKCKDAQKILIAVSVLCGLVQFKRPPFRKAILYQLMILLCQRFPVVRRTTAEQLYEVVITYDDLVEGDENMDTIVCSLMEVEWDQPVEQLRPTRNQLCACFGVPVPKLLKPVIGK